MIREDLFDSLSFTDSFKLRYPFHLLKLKILFKYLKQLAFPSLRRHGKASQGQEAILKGKGKLIETVAIGTECVTG